jgi:hypothetical protein
MSMEQEFSGQERDVMAPLESPYPRPQGYSIPEDYAQRVRLLRGPVGVSPSIRNSLPWERSVSAANRERVFKAEYSA